MRRDFEWEEYGVIAEADGELGHSGEGMRRDRSRDRLAVRAGRITLRCVWVDVVHDACELALDIGRRRSERSAPPLVEDWDSWWAGAAADPELARVLAHRADAGRPHCEGNDLTLSGHVALLRDAGFEHVGPVWQVGPSHVLAALR